MGKLKKLGIALIFAFFLILINAVTSNASGSLYLDKLDFDAKINSDGSMDVTETWHIDVSHTNTLYKTFKRDSSKYSGISDVKVSEITTGYAKQFTEINREMYHVTKNCYYGLINSKGEFEIAWGIGMDNSRGNRVYQISYKVKDAVSKNPDCYELYWQFVGEKFEIDAGEIVGKIKLPQSAKTKEDIKVWGHTEDLNGEIYVTSTDTVEFKLNDFNSGRYVEVRVAMPEYFYIYTGRSSYKTVDNIISEETVWAEEANARREFRKQLATSASFLIIFISGIGALFVIRNIRKKCKILKETKKYVPIQELKYYRDIPDENVSPGEALMLLKQNAKEFLGIEIGNIFSAILLNLSLRKMIEFEMQNDSGKKEKIIIKLLFNDVVGITREDDKAVCDFLLKADKNKNGKISLKELEKYIKSHSSQVISLKKKLDKQAKETLISNMQVDKDAIKQKNKAETSIFLYVFGLIYIGIFSIIIGTFIPLSFIGTGILLTCLIIGLIKACKVSKNVNVFTQLGVDEGGKWKALKNFMNDFSTMDRKEIPEIILWEKYLVYATAFGMADKVIKQLKLVYPDFENNTNFSGSIYIGHMMHSDFSSSMSHSISSAMSSTYSSSTGGGGGFSGGGGGGRRPEAAAEVVKLKGLSIKPETVGKVVN